MSYPGWVHVIETAPAFSLPETPLLVRKGLFIPILMQPTADNVDLPPAGALYPLDSSGGHRVQLNWEEGPLCRLLLKLISEGIDIETINIERLVEEIGERALGDPWKLDWEAIGSALLSGSFRSSRIRRRPERTVVLDAREGLWFTESPFSPLYKSRPGAGLELSLPLGFHRIFHASSKLYLEIQVGENDTAVVQRRGRISRSSARASPAESPEHAIRPRGFSDGPFPDVRR
jgi:hypothetical protein